MKDKRIINYESIKYISDHKLEQMYNSYCDWCRKHSYSLLDMNMYRSVEYRIQTVVCEIKRRKEILIRRKIIEKS